MQNSHVNFCFSASKINPASQLGHLYVVVVELILLPQNDQGRFVPHSEQNLAVFFAPHSGQNQASFTGLGLPHSEQNFPEFSAPHEHFQVPADIGLGLPHSEQNFPLFSAPQVHFQVSVVVERFASSALRCI